MPLTGAQARAQLADRARVNATTIAAAPNTATGLVVSVELRFVGGKQFVPEDLYDALDTKYGSGKVTSPLDNLGRTGPFRFDINP